MNIEATYRNALNLIKKRDEELEKEVEDRNLDMLTSISLSNPERWVEIFEEIVPKITTEEWKRIHHGIIGLNDREELMACKDIKEKYGLSWSEFESVRPYHRDTPRERYDKKYAKGVYLKLNQKTDRDILDKLDEVNNKQGYIKELIRRDMEG